MVDAPFRRGAANVHVDDLDGEGAAQEGGVEGDVGGAHGDDAGVYL